MMPTQTEGGRELVLALMTTLSYWHLQTHHTILRAGLKAKPYNQSVVVYQK